ncbi:MAG: TMEM175 family protein, partial [Microthrixaceae bacterium]
MASRPTARRYGRDSTEFGRVVNLSDGIFAIALTLLVLNLVVPGVQADQLGGMWRDLVPSLVAFVLAFGLVANIWWLHHKVFAALETVEPGMIALNVVGLAGVALVPFPTSLVGAHPDQPAAVVPFLG